MGAAFGGSARDDMLRLCQMRLPCAPDAPTARIMDSRRTSS
jgi:hypothetical protein